MRLARPHLPFFFFFNDTATTEIYTLSLHDALPITSAESAHTDRPYSTTTRCRLVAAVVASAAMRPAVRSEEHTSELQSQSNLVCRLLLEKKKRFARLPRSRSCMHARCGRTDAHGE